MLADIASPVWGRKTFAAPLAHALGRRGIHYGWLMVALIFVFSMCAAASMSIPGVLLTPISRDLGWSIGELSGPLGLRMALFGLVAPFAGGLIMLHGPRKVLIGSAVLLIAGLLVAATMTAKWQLWIGLGIAMGVATWHDGAGDGHDDRHALVHRTPWHGAGCAGRGQRHRPVDLPDARGVDRQHVWLADGAAAACLCDRGPCVADHDARRRPAVGYSARTLWRDSRRARSAAANGQRVRPEPRHAADGVTVAGVLGADLHLLRLWRVELRPDAALRHAVRRLRDQPDDLHEFAGHDRGVRPVRHARLGMVVGPVRQSLAAGGVLRLPRAGTSLAAISAVSPCSGCRSLRCSTGSTS